MKVTIWGHKLHSSTHSYIHLYYFRAFKALGYEVVWVNEKDNIEPSFFKNSLILTEGQVDKNIPLHHSNCYVLHHCYLSKYQNAGAPFLQLGNYTAKNPFDNCEKVNSHTFFHKKTRTLYQPWGTDLLPNEIDPSMIIPFKPTLNVINYIGTIWGDNKPSIDRFAKEANKNKVAFRNYCSGQTPYIYGENHTSYFFRRVINKIKIKLDIKKIIDDNFAKKLTTESLISPDLRNVHHINVGYIPCRIFKNISYGMLPGTNSHHINHFFDELLPYSSNESELFHKNISECSNSSYIKKMQHLMNLIRENHTYINRAKQIINFI